MLANKGDIVEASGILEEVSSKEKGIFYRVSIGYFDAYLDGKIVDEYIKPILPYKKEKQHKTAQITDKKEILTEIQNKFSKEICEFCKEQRLKIGNTTSYGAKIICKVGNNNNNNDNEDNDNNEGWFATLSSKTAGDPEQDFSIQLIPSKHLRYFSEINSSKELAQNYGIIFAKVSYAISKVMDEESKNNAVLPIATYGKCKHPDEHIHIKLFPYKGDIAQPFTTDSSYERKEIYKDKQTGEEFIKMKPVKKKQIAQNRLDELARKLITLCN
jgi:hypothetical protein